MLGLIRNGDLTDFGIFIAGMFAVAMFLIAIGAGA